MWRFPEKFPGILAAEIFRTFLEIPRSYRKKKAHKHKYFLPATVRWGGKSPGGCPGVKDLCAIFAWCPRNIKLFVRTRLSKLPLADYPQVSPRSYPEQEIVFENCISWCSPIPRNAGICSISKAQSQKCHPNEVASLVLVVSGVL